MSSRGRVVIPHALRVRCRLVAGDHFVVEDKPRRQVITLRKVPDAARWFGVYMQCPYAFDVPKRSRNLAVAIRSS